MKSFLLGTVAVVVSGVTFTAAAADLPQRLPTKAPPLVAAANWSGFYAGLNIGAARQTSCSRFTPQGDLDPVNDNFLASLDVGCSSSTGVIGGAQAGFNQQFGRWIFGLEADFDGLTTKTSRNTSGISGGGNLFTANQTTTLDMLATVRPRIGALVNDSTMVYVTGGMAMAHVNAQGSETGPVGPPQFQGFGSVSQWTPGWTVGAGVEAKLFGGPWSVKAEYLYVNLAAVHYDSRQPPVNVGTGFDNIGDNIGMATQLHIARVGVNYAFGEPRGARDAYAAVGPVAHNWTGLYAGAHGGGVWGTAQSREPNTDVTGFGPWNAFGDTITARPSGVMGGAQAGYNVQMNSFVVGVEGDLGYLRFKGQETENGPFGPTIVNSSGGIYGTFRGRVGFAWDRALFYGTGGLMVADVGTHVSSPFNPGGGSDGILFTDRTGTQTGWVAGGGIEYALAHGWSAKGEYLHFDLGTKRVFGACVNCTNPPPVFAFDIQNNGDIFRVGINKKIF